jgi:hypothetical protein
MPLVISTSGGALTVTRPSYNTSIRNLVRYGLDCVRRDAVRAWLGCGR